MATMELIDQATELKERLILRIESTHNLDVLQDMLSILDENAEESMYELTPEEMADIEERIRDCQAGLGIPHEIVATEIREKVYELTPEEREALRRGEEDYRNGRWITQEKLQNKIVQWRKETKK